MIQHVYVFHAQDSRDWITSNRSVIAKLALDFPTEVAIEEVLELAFEKSNSITNNWMDNPEVVTKYVPKARSTSVGDMLLTYDRKFIVEAFGFREVVRVVE